MKTSLPRLRHPITVIPSLRHPITPSMSFDQCGPLSRSQPTVDPTYVAFQCTGPSPPRAARVSERCLRPTEANATGGPERPRALNVTLASQQIGGQRQRPHWWSLAEVKQTLRNAVRGREVPSAEAMLFTAGLIAAIMMMSAAYDYGQVGRKQSEVRRQPLHEPPLRSAAPAASGAGSTSKIQ
ncbi:unnamed protein product [Durusdinium trenchii]|uniref:Uncharacterized protein n=1 Tax=Durusdinium trenchii TaxID=1381693 RepID=A0ABP0MWV9_9DINO